MRSGFHDVSNISCFDGCYVCGQQPVCRAYSVTIFNLSAFQKCMSVFRLTCIQCINKIWAYLKIVCKPQLPNMLNVRLLDCAARASNIWKAGYALCRWFSKFFHTPSQSQTLSIPPQQKLKKDNYKNITLPGYGSRRLLKIYPGDNQGRRNSGRARGQYRNWGQWKLINNNKRKLPIMIVSVKQQCWPQNYKKETIENLFQFDRDIPWNYLWCCYEKDTSAPLPPFERSGGQCPRSPASLHTAISSHCLAALPAKISAFNSHMWQNTNFILLRNEDQQ